MLQTTVVRLLLLAVIVTGIAGNICVLLKADISLSPRRTFARAASQAGR